MPMTERYRKLTQLNERVSESQYDVLYPETVAEQVIESTDKQFVSQAQIDLWTRIADAGLLYRGPWTAGEDYAVYDFVSFSDSSHSTKYYICLTENTASVGNAPQINASTSTWLNLNLDSTNADFADTIATIKMSIPASGTQNYYITGVNSNNNSAQFEQLFTEGSIYISIDSNGIARLHTSGIDNTGTITSTGNITAPTFIGALQGTASNAIRAKEADEYVRYYRSASGTYVDEHGDPSNVPVEKDTYSIDTAIDALQRGADEGTTGKVLINKLTLQKDGVTESVYDNSQGVTFNVKQTYGPADLNAGSPVANPFIVNDKISEGWLPDSILGQLSYKGTYDASVSQIRTATNGDYYIVTTAGNYWPSGTLVPGYTEQQTPPYLNVGDWAIFNGTDGWSKVDNTDAVTMVNNQIGAVEIYKLAYTSGVHYYRGDIVKETVSGCLYICNTEHVAGETMTAAYWDLFGRTYSAADAIKLEGTVFKHDVISVTATAEEIAAASKTLNTATASGASFTVPVITKDGFGHITKLFDKTITIGDDFVNTWRPVYLNSTATNILDNSTSTPLIFKGDDWISFTFANNILNVNHEEVTAAVEPNMEAEKITDSQEGDDVLYAGQGYTIPSFTVDGAGHIVASEMKRVRLADTPFTHSHFNIASVSGSNAKNIEAYAASIAISSWVNDDNNALKFYLGTVNPTKTTRMNFNGALNATQLWQGANRVLDASIQLDNGVATNGTYDPSTGILSAPDSGITAGTYSVLTVNAKGIATAGGQIIEFGSVVDADPSNGLAVGGLFFRLMGTVTA